MFLALAFVLILSPQPRPLAIDAALPATTLLYAGICRLDTGRMHEHVYREGDPAEHLVELLEKRGAWVVKTACFSEHLCDLSATVRHGSVELEIEAGVFRRSRSGPLKLHTIRVRGPKWLIEKAQAHAGCR